MTKMENNHWFSISQVIMYTPILKQSLGMIQSGVLLLNVVAAFFHLVLAGVALALLKRAAKPVTRAESTATRENRKEDLEGVNFDRVMAVSWLKKYTLIGGAFCEDQKFMVKEVVIIAVFGVACLHINKLTLWPAVLSLTVLLLCFVCWDVVSKKWSSRIKEVSEARPSIVGNQAESELQIQAVGIQPRVNIISTPSALAPAKHNSTPRNPFETLSIAVLVFACLVMQFQTVMTLSTSISNSGELNIISVLAAIGIDQVAVRIPLGVTVAMAIKLYLLISGGAMEESGLVGLICSEQIKSILLLKQKQRERKAVEMAASPPRQKRDSPSRIPKAILQSAQRSTYLNLINLQPTVREAEDEVVEQVYLTAEEKDMFEEANVLEQKNGFYTRRQRREGKDYYSHSAQKGTTIDARQKKQFDDILILKDDPFGELQNVGEFCLQESCARETRRKGVPRRKNKRNLQLTGNSPYLQYLPDMLKKVDKFKEMAGNKENANTKPIR